MKLFLENIGKVRSASVEINGITVIAGENNTGKSTIGKALFAVFNCFYNSERKIAADRANSIENLLESLYVHATGDYFFDFEDTDIIKKILTLVGAQHSEETLKQMIYEIIAQGEAQTKKHISESDISMFAERIVSNIKVSDDEIFRRVLQRRLDAEFNEQISSRYAWDKLGSISLSIRNDTIEIALINDRVVSANKRITLGTEAIYIDDPFTIDEVSTRMWRESRKEDHRTHLKEKMFYSKRNTNVVEEIVTANKLDYIYRKVSTVCEGDVVREKRSNLSYRVAGFDTSLDIRNLSTGLKTFAILKLLLVNGQIEPNGTIILDEPEIHLHPEWQLLFAELIVLLHREFGLHILLNTHSPYFLNAIEVYAAKYQVDDKCKYYLAHNDKDMAVVEDVTNNLEKIYSKLARPLQDLENMRCGNET